MKQALMLASFLIPFFSANSQVKSVTDYDSYPVYTGRDLGLTYTKTQSSFKVWAPTATALKLRLYKAGAGGEAVATHDMKKDKEGTWLIEVKGDQHGRYYTFSAMIDGKWMDEVPDPYAKATGINGKRGMVIELPRTNPAGWLQDKSTALTSPVDAVIYELHVRDASIAASSGIKAKGKFLGLTETGTTNSAGLSTGLDHFKEMGVTHIHLLPFFDYNSVDETQPDQKYNWGYDPLNYNVPEGSYATDAADGARRIKEFKELVKVFHANGLKVVMDVVYNHTGLTNNSNFNQLVPGYYYRHTADGKLSDATACGNETASERAMMRKFIIESMAYWVNEYHIDGFRVDLMGVHDITTMNLASRELNKIKPGILLYGEGWTAGSSPLPDSARALKKNVAKLEKIAVFSDDIRDGIKGSVFDHEDRGFVSGKPGMEESIKFGIVAALQHPQIDYSKVNYSKAAYAAQPSQTVTYTECHDNHTLWDKLAISAKDATDAQRKEMHKLALSIVLTSQGIPFLHAGTEFLRSKKGIENSYESPDNINEIDWDQKTANKDVADYVRALIQLRKAHPAFRIKDKAAIAANVRFVSAGYGIIIYEISARTVGDSWQKILVCLNGNTSAKTAPLIGKWKVAVENNAFVEEKSLERSLRMAPTSCTILYQ
ncbi:type I pullulanase [Terrimonas sp. NA20]|uniref:Type I pullulanase n=1 Tax=Terrimonas ginsenosidimutans TaxID=2908004 RepID=A0ABS9KWH4_9BACT|nr:type I pullulanase [Terrimonas ginsenosidimutans]MCG2616607.1 type I pullulanase [Terrimonas ginsenosidimutans]